MSLDSAAALREVAMFRWLPDEEMEILSHQVTRRQYGRNEVIFSQGDAGDGVHIVTAGHVSITRSSTDGDELILTMCEPGESFGELALLDQKPRSASAVAVDECTTLFLSSGVFHAWLREHPAALLICLKAIAAQLRRLTDLADEIALLDVRSRLARRLLRLAEQGAFDAGPQEQSDSREPFRITQQQLASMTGMTRESVNKQLKQMTGEGIIEMERGHIRVLNVTRLRTVSEYGG